MKRKKTRLARARPVDPVADPESKRVRPGEQVMEEQKAGEA